MPVSSGRTCGGRTAYCKPMAISELEKPLGVWCEYCEKGRGVRYL
jgi:hypothetical protein